MTELTVDLSDLKGYADLVRRAAADCTAMGLRSAVDIPDGDFGRILELVTLDYEAILPPFRHILEEDGRRLDRVASTLDAVAGDFAETDHGVALAFGFCLPMPVERGRPSFGDVAAVSQQCLAAPPLELPVLHVGVPLDQVFELLVRIGLPDPRDLLLRLIVGDMTKAMTQAAYWDQFASNVDHVCANLAHGAGRIRQTWEGRAAERADAEMRRWLAALHAQSQAMTDLGDHLRAMVGQAIEAARMIVDTVRFFASTVAAGLACAYLPIYGEIQLVNKVRDAWHLIRDAQRVLAMFMGFLRVMNDAFHQVVDGFAAIDLPAAPALPARHAA